MIKIYTLTKYLNSDNRRRVFPLLFDLWYLNNQYSLDRYILVDNPEDADLAVFPIDIVYLFNIGESSVFWEFIREANSNGIPAWIYTAGDFGKTFSENFITFRLGGFKTKLSENTEIMPCFVSDPYLHILEGNWRPIVKTNMPTIGFVGKASGGLDKFMKEYLIFLKQSFLRIIGNNSTDVQAFFSSSLFRSKVLKTLTQNSSIDSNFISRKHYRAAAKTEEAVKVTTRDFYKNIENNLYTLCIRGAGNFSVRFYETLIMGRIPILIETDIQLPLSNIINWENHIIFATIKNVEQKVLDFHQSKSTDDLIEIQKGNRRLVLDKLNRVDYFKEVSNKYFNK